MRENFIYNKETIYIYSFISKNMTGATREAGTAYPH